MSITELHQLHLKIPSQNNNEKSQLQPQKKERSSIIGSGDENKTLIHEREIERDCFRSPFGTACLFVMLE